MHTHWTALGFGLASAALVLACGGESAGPDARPADSFDRQALLKNVGENLLVPAYDAFAAAATQLETEVAVYCAAVGSGTEAAALTQAQTAWRQAMEAWQLTEAMLLGPAAMDGATLKLRVYSWPLVSSCAVDQEVETYRGAPGSYDIATKLNNRRGLDAIEYLLFSPSLDHTCTDLTAPPGWNDLADVERRSARCGYAGLASADVRAQADIVVQAWSPAGGNFLADLSTAGDSGSSFSSAQEAVNVVSDALFYLDVDVKSMKIGSPAGITVNTCGTAEEPCEDALESPWADHSLENIRQNMRGFSLLFHGDAVDGSAGLGFDDFLDEVGAATLSDEISANTTAMIAAAGALSPPLRTALAADYEGVVATHDATRAVSTLLKTQFLTVLGLDLPDSAAGDND